MIDYRPQISSLLDTVLIPKIRTLALRITDIEKSSTNSTSLWDARKELNYYNLICEYLTGYAYGNEEVEEYFLHMMVSLIGSSPLKASSSENAGIIRPVIKPQIENEFVIHANGIRIKTSSINLSPSISVISAQFLEPCYAVRVWFDSEYHLSFGSFSDITMSMTLGTHVFRVEALDEDMKTIHDKSYQVIVQ